MNVIPWKLQEYIKHTLTLFLVPEESLLGKAHSHDLVIKCFPPAH